MSTTADASPRSRRRLTPDQRRVLTAMAETHELWTIGNLFFVLRSYGIPTRREELAALLGLPLIRDEAAELAAQARFHRVHMHNPAEAVTLLRRAAALVPGDASCGSSSPSRCTPPTTTPDALAAAIAPSRSTPITPPPTSSAASSSSTPTRLQAAASLRPRRRARPPAAAGPHQPVDLPGDDRPPRRGPADPHRPQREHPEFAEGWYSLGLALVKLGRHPSRDRALDRAIALDPDHANAHYARACAHALQGRARPRPSPTSPAPSPSSPPAPGDPRRRRLRRPRDDPEFQRSHRRGPAPTPPPPAPGPGLRN
jgi:tetratricopeptide (TPR) repeat protein